MDRNRLSDAIITPEEENVEVALVENEIVSLSDITRQLDELRERAALMSREKDIDYVSKLEVTMEAILESLNQVIGNNPELLANTIYGLIKGGRMDQVKHMMVALSIAADKREQLLGFDPTRSDTKRKKIQVMFKSSNGEQAGVSIEQ